MLAVPRIPGVSQPEPESMELGLKLRQELERLTLLIALLLVLFIAIFTYRAWAAFEHSRQQALLNRQTVDGVTALLSSLKDAESGQLHHSLSGSNLASVRGRSATASAASRP